MTQKFSISAPQSKKMCTHVEEAAMYKCTLNTAHTFGILLYFAILFCVGVWVQVCVSPCWSRNQKPPRSMQAGWWGAGRRSSFCRSWPRWWHTRAWRWRNDAKGFWISAVSTKAEVTHSLWHVYIMSMRLHKRRKLGGRWDDARLKVGEKKFQCRHFRYVGADLCV